MGWYLFPDLKSEEVVCQKECKHESCISLRKTSDICTLCGEQIEPGRPGYMMEDPHHWAHARCVWDQVELDAYCARRLMQ